MIRKYIVTATTVLLIITGCATNQGVKKEITKAQEANIAIIKEAESVEKAALEFFRKGGFQRSSELFEKAVDIYHGIGDKEREKIALAAQAKAQLCAGDRYYFIKTMNLVRKLIKENEIPPDDISFLYNIADRMDGKPLTYPVIHGYEDIFIER